jgi:hypothetical protein
MNLHILLFDSNSPPIFALMLFQAAATECAGPSCCFFLLHLLTKRLKKQSFP